MISVIMIATPTAMIASQRMRERNRCGRCLRGGRFARGRSVGMVATIAALVLHVSTPPELSAGIPIAMNSSQTVGAAAEKTRELLVVVPLQSPLKASSPDILRNLADHRPSTQ
jgi:hypothetical protein